MVMMSMGRDYVFKLRKQRAANLLFMPQVIYEHGEPRWNDIDKIKLIRPPQLLQSYQQSSRNKTGGTGEKIMIFAL
jgi:hypothetical protein